MDVKKEREKRGMTQAQLAELTGIKPAVLSRVENFATKPQAKTMFKIKQAFGKPTDKHIPPLPGRRFINWRILSVRSRLYDGLVKPGAH